MNLFVCLVTGSVKSPPGGETAPITETLPFSPLCTPDCPGLCPDCGVRLLDAEPDHHHDKIDPRWAKLSALLPETPDTDGASSEGGS